MIKPMDGKTQENCLFLICIHEFSKNNHTLQQVTMANL